MVSTSADTAGSTRRVSAPDKTIPLKYVDLSKVPDEDSSVACTKILPDLAQTNATPASMESERGYIHRCYQQTTTLAGIDMDKFSCLQEAQPVTDSILDEALERQLSPTLRGMEKHLTRNLMTPVWNPDSRHECGITRLCARQRLRNTEAMFILYHSPNHYNGVIALHSNRTHMVRQYAV
jgi:hypothetical protein